MDSFTLYNEAGPAVVDASEGKIKRLMNTGGDILYYGTAPAVTTDDASLAPGESTQLTDRMYLVTEGYSDVIVDEGAA